MRIVKVVSIVVTGIAALILFCSVWYVYRPTSDNFSCTSDDFLLHEGMQMRARYILSIVDGNGSIRVIGAVTSKGESYPVSRQIHFTYTRQDNEYLLTSTHIVTFSNDKGIESAANKHYPAFFSLAGQKLTVKILNDRYDNKVIYFGGVPLFYCLRDR